MRNINLPSATIVGGNAFFGCSLTDVKFGSKLEKIGVIAFCNCQSLQRITAIPLKDGLITDDKTFMSCDNLNRVDLIGEN